MRVRDRRFSEVIGEALDRFPSGMRHRLSHVQFLCGVDPGFAGFHDYTIAGDGRLYDSVAHCVYPYHITRPASERVTTIVLPTMVPPITVVHELAHALHETIDFEYHPNPVSKYAHTNRYEAFAEALTTHLHYGYADEDILYSDRRTMVLFAELSLP